MISKIIAEINLADYQQYIFLIIGLVLVGVTIFSKSSKSNLKETGIAVEGIIFEQGSENLTLSLGNTDNNYSSVNDKVTVRFVTLEKEWITAPINQSFQSFYTGQYKNGEKIKLYYDKANPYSFYVETKQSELLGRIIAGLAGIIFILIGVYKMFSK